MFGLGCLPHSVNGVVDKPVIEFTGNLMDLFIELGLAPDPQADQRKRWSNFSANLNNIAETLATSSMPTWVVVKAQGQPDTLTSALDNDALIRLDSNSEEEYEVPPPHPQPLSPLGTERFIDDSKTLASTMTLPQQAASTKHTAAEASQAPTKQPHRPLLAKLNMEDVVAPPPTSPTPVCSQLTFADVFNLRSFASPLAKTDLLPPSPLQPTAGPSSRSHDTSPPSSKGAADPSLPPLQSSHPLDPLSPNASPAPDDVSHRDLATNQATVPTHTLIPPSTPFPQAHRPQGASTPSTQRNTSSLSCQSAQSDTGDADAGRDSGIETEPEGLVLSKPNNGLPGGSDLLGNLSDQGEDKADNCDEESVVTSHPKRVLGNKRPMTNSPSPSASRHKTVPTWNPKRCQRLSSAPKRKRGSKHSKPSLSEALRTADGSVAGEEDGSEPHNTVNKDMETEDSPAPFHLSPEPARTPVGAGSEADGDEDMDVSSLTNDGKQEDKAHDDQDVAMEAGKTGLEAPHLKERAADMASLGHGDKASCITAPHQPLKRANVTLGHGAAVLQQGLPSGYTPLPEGLQEDELFKPDWFVAPPVSPPPRKKKKSKKKMIEKPVVNAQAAVPPPCSWYSFCAPHMTVAEGNDEGKVRIEEGSYQFPFSPKVCSLRCGDICYTLLM